MSPKLLKRTKADACGVKASDLWRTPAACFNALHDEFDFEIDLAARTEDALLSTWLGPGSALAEDALAVEWAELAVSIGALGPEPMRGVGYLNPPYSSQLIRQFLLKAALEARAGFTTVALVPYTPDTRWWRLTDSAAEIRDIPHRIPYLKADGVTKTGAMFPSAVVVFRPQPGLINPTPRHVLWSYRHREDGA